MSGNTEPKHPGGPFRPGDPRINRTGKNRGSRHRASLAVDAMLDGEANEITRKAIELAKAGDGTALRLCIERLSPPRRDRPVAFALPPLATATDAVQATAALVSAVAAGELTPGEAAELSKLVDSFTRAIEVHDVQERLAAVEAELRKEPGL